MWGALVVLGGVVRRSDLQPGGGGRCSELVPQCKLRWIEFGKHVCFQERISFEIERGLSPKVGCYCWTGARKDRWKTGSRVSVDEGPAQDKGPSPNGGRLPIISDVIHQHITTKYVVQTRINKRSCTPLQKTDSHDTYVRVDRVTEYSGLLKDDDSWYERTLEMELL
jgi:hypothetical protein